MEKEREFKDLPLAARLLCFFVLTLGLSVVVVTGVIEARQSCDPRPVYVRGSNDPGAAPWER